MADTNYFSGIIKILENPKQIIINRSKTSTTTFRAELSQIRKSKVVSLIFWGTLANEVKAYYQVNDYLLINGYISVKNEKHRNLTTKNSKQVTITVLKVYPFFCKPNLIPNKIT